MAWSDDRSHHAAQPMRWLYALRPEWCALEQVPAVLPLWQHIGRTLTEWGYSVWCGVLNAADYGVPQIRRRAILVASRARRVACPPATHYDVRRRGNGLFGAPWISMAEALGWGCEDRPSPTVTGGGTGSGGGVEVFAGRAARAAVAFRGSRRPHATLRELDEPAPTVVCSADRWTIDRPATTVQADPRISPPGHRDRAGGERQHQGSIRISVAQAALLQGFRADYPWRGSSTAQYAQIGNAVPPPLAADVIAVATGARLP
jgi:DNA (cytosine-5)-methyltransferase 1